LRKFAFPYKVIEYMAAGLVVIGTTGTETARILRKYGSGITTPFVPEKLTESLRTLASHPEKMMVMREAGLKAAAHYDWEDLMDQEYKLILGSWHTSK
jgi:glycosyltransferase involved in cell wall biosynthesis